MIATLLALSTLAPLVQEAPQFGVAVDTVRVDVYVGRGDRPLEGLTAASFEVRDDGVVREVRLVARERAALHAVLLLDVSASVSGPRLAALKNAARAFLAGLEPRDRATLLVFSYGVRRIGAARAPASQVAHALDSVPAGGPTALHDAVYAAMAATGAPSENSVLVVFSDGQDRVSWLPMEAVVRAARRSQSPVYAVFLADRLAPRQPGGYGPPHRGLEPTPPFLEKLATESNGRLLRATDPEELIDRFRAIAREAKASYVLEFQLDPHARAGWHDLDVRVRLRGATVRARRGYFLAR